MPPLPKVDDRLVDIFLSVILLKEFLPYTCHCGLGAKHRPKVDAGQDAKNPQRLFIVYEEASCCGIDGRRCHNNGLQYLKQLTESQKVAAISHVVQLEPIPYNSEALLDWCVNYLVTRQHLLPGQFDAVPRHPPVTASTTLPRTLPRGLPLPTSHEIRHRRWVSSLIPSSNNLGAGSRRGPSCVIPCARSSASVSLSAPGTTLTKVYCYVRNGYLPEVVEVKASQQEAMTYVNLRHADILKVFGLKPRARNLPERIQVYDTYGDKWYHPAAVLLWLHLHSNEALILKASTVTRTPGLEDYVLKTFNKPHLPSSDSLRGFLALSRTPADRHPPFSAIPPLTVMLAGVPENPASSLPSRTTTDGRREQATALECAVASSSSHMPAPKCTHGGKRRKHNDGSASAVGHDIIEISSDDDDSPAAALQLSKCWSTGDGLPANQRPRKRVLHPYTSPTVLVKPSKGPRIVADPEVIVISDDDEAALSSSTRKCSDKATRPREVIVIDDDDEPLSVMPPVGCSTSVPSGSRGGGAGPSSRGLRVLTPCTSFAVYREYYRKGKGKSRAADKDGDGSGVDSDKTLC